MKYYEITQEEGNCIPYGINSNREIDIRWLNPENIDKIGRKNILSMNLPREAFFPDMLFDPCILVSRTFMETILMYQEGIIYRSFKLLHFDTRKHVTYFCPLLEEVSCLSEKTQYNNTGNRIIKLILEADKIQEKAAFKVDGYHGRYMIGREDFVESILRRGACGICFEEVEINGNRWY